MVIIDLCFCLSEQTSRADEPSRRTTREGRLLRWRPLAVDSRPHQKNDRSAGYCEKRRRSCLHVSFRTCLFRIPTAPIDVFQTGMGEDRPWASTKFATLVLPVPSVEQANQPLRCFFSRSETRFSDEFTCRFFCSCHFLVSFGSRVFVCSEICVTNGAV